MTTYQPRSKEELADILRSASEQSRTVTVRGAGTKDGMAGPIHPSDIGIETTAMASVLQYEPRDLTISVEAGMRWRALTGLLAANRQTIPLDPPFSADATVGGVVAANTSGPRRRLYGTARDFIIGMQFATLEGKIIQSGGMVVKNVAGLDMGKLMIGSFGTLAALAVVNFKLIPMPLRSATFVRQFPSSEDAIRFRNAVLEDILQPSSLDILNPAASELMGMLGWNTVIHVDAPNEAVIQRYAAELGGDAAHPSLMEHLVDFTRRYLAAYPEGAVARISTRLTGVEAALTKATGAAVARSASGVIYRYHPQAKEADLQGEDGAIEFAPASYRAANELWPSPGNDFGIMTRIKEMFDPNTLLNRGRLYGRI